MALRGGRGPADHATQRAAGVQQAERAGPASDAAGPEEEPTTQKRALVFFLDSPQVMMCPSLSAKDLDSDGVLICSNRKALYKAESGAPSAEWQVRRPRLAEPLVERSIALLRGGDVGAEAQLDVGRVARVHDLG